MLSEPAFREECLAFLEANAKLRTFGQAVAWGSGDDSVALFHHLDADAERQAVETAKSWRRLRFDAGLAWISGPAEHGGRELPRSYERLYSELEAKFDVPDQGLFRISLGMVAPTILAHGQDVLRAQCLRSMYRGDLVACQLFSEPGAGSDLASVQTVAAAVGGGWVVNGQKVWTSRAHTSDIGILLCRTDLTVPKHQGLTAFIVDMHAPGVEVRPLRQMNGGSAFSEVFLTDVRIPDTHRLGEAGQGWTVALTTLMNERASIASGAGVDVGFANVANTDRLIALLRHCGAADDPTLRQDLCRIYATDRVARWTNARAVQRIRQGVPPGPELSIGKLMLTGNLDEISRFVGRVLGPALSADTGEWGTYAWTQYVLGVPGLHLGGGTDEILRTILGERVLGLPKEPSPTGTREG